MKPRVYVETQHRQLPDCAARAGDIRELLRQASADVEGHRFGAHFLRTEWSTVVDAWQLASWEDYRDVQRLGRKTRLAEKQRELLWSIGRGRSRWRVVLEAHPVGIESLIRLDIRERDLVGTRRLHAVAEDNRLELVPERFDLLLEFDTLCRPSGLASFLMGNGEDDVAPVGCSLRELVKRAETQVHALNPLAVFLQEQSFASFGPRNEPWRQPRFAIASPSIRGSRWTARAILGEPRSWRAVAFAARRRALRSRGFADAPRAPFVAWTPNRPMPGTARWRG